MTRWLRALLCCWLAICALAGSDVAAAGSVDYNRDIRPILSDNCYACHGPDEKARKGGLRLDQREEAFKKLDSGATAIVPGQSANSELLRRLTTTDEDDRMPPAKTGKKLSDAQIQTLKRWIDEGAVWTGHWAYVKPQRPSVPEAQNKSWPRNDIDRFIAHRLEREGLKPSPEAPKERLIRRVSLDLTGLPPTVDEVEAFLYDNSSDAYEKLVDRLLKSPHYGERMAQFWLDLARFADSAGYHHDSHRDMWHWRDWVIKAFNDNKPFDQFTIEQLAGDLLPNPTREQLIATGFHRNEMTTAEGGADPNEYSVKYVVGRVDTTSRVWLGTSMACAECHDHKYDPISQRDFYQFFAYFNTIAENGLDQQENPVPRLPLDTPEQRAKAQQFDREIAALEAAHKSLVESPHAERDAAQAEWQNKLRKNVVTNWTILEPASLSARHATLAAHDDFSIAASGSGSTNESFELTFRTSQRNITGLRLEVIPDGSADGDSGSAKKPGVFVLSEFEAQVRAVAPETEPAAKPPALDSWRVLGPFSAASGAEAFEKVFGPEKGAALDQTFEGGKLKWTEATAWTDGQALALTNARAAQFFYRTIRADEPRWAKLSFGSTGGLQVWWNGRRVLSKETAPPVQTPENVVVHLRQGENTLLVKQTSDSEEAKFYFKLHPEPVHEHAIEFAAAAADANAKEFPVAGAIDDQPDTGWSVDESAASRTVHAYFRTQDPVGFSEGSELKVRLKFEAVRRESALRRFRLAVTTSEGLTEFFGLTDTARAALAPDDASRSTAQKIELQKYYRQTFIPEVQELTKLIANQRKAKDDFVRTIPVTMILQEMEKPRDTFVLIRGHFQNKGEKVTPGVPKSIFAMPPDYPANRLGLAKWLVHPDHPLVSRVIVNHFWQRYFGSGLVKTAEDFGSQGELPSHPELLDWLATEFVRLKWDIKAMQRLMVTSATYRQDAPVSAEHLKRDPDNRLLARFPRARLDAEAIRDTVMSVSGLLDAKIGGPSVYPYQPPGLWEAVTFENSRKYIQSTGKDNYRRGLYVYWRRSMPYPSMVAFDAPTRETCTVKRPRTNTPLQALTLLNDPVYVEAARAFGERILRQGGPDVESRLNYAFRVCLSRRPTKAERLALERAFHEHLKEYEANRVAAAQLINVGASPPPIDLDLCELAAWTVIANTLLNLDETITKG